MERETSAFIHISSNGDLPGALVLTPYLRSIFAFNPDATAISALLLIVKIHVISAFVLIVISKL